MLSAAKRIFRAFNSETVMSTILKIALVLLTVALALIISGLSGILFEAWPTSACDHVLIVDARTIDKLRQLKDQKKFTEDMSHFYPGAPNEVVRIAAQLDVDGLLDNLISNLATHPRRSFVLSAIKSALPAFDSMDSEEKDEALVYFEQAMAICGVKHSGELLNVWRYGFPYGWAKNPKNM